MEIYWVGKFAPCLLFVTLLTLGFKIKEIPIYKKTVVTDSLWKIHHLQFVLIWPFYFMVRIWGKIPHFRLWSWVKMNTMSILVPFSFDLQLIGISPLYFRKYKIWFEIDFQSDLINNRTSDFKPQTADPKIWNSRVHGENWCLFKWNTKKNWTAFDTGFSESKEYCSCKTR